MCASSQSDSFDLPCTPLPHFRIDPHNPAPRITFGKQNVCAAAIQMRAPSRLRSCKDGVARKRPPSGGLLLPALRRGASLGNPYAVVVPSVSLVAVLQGTALTVFVETPSGATLSKPGPVSISGKPVPRRALAQMCQCHLWVALVCATTAEPKPRMLPPSEAQLIA